jgi:ferredoxin
MPYFITDECMLCGACESGCEVSAIYETEEKNVIDQSICIECGTCEMNCPFDAIICVTEEELANLTNS